MAEQTKTIRIKWVRSGIGFTRHQKSIVRSLGLNKLNHTVVRPDTPQIRGIVASVPHLLEIVSEPATPAWASISEYTVLPPVADAASSGSATATPGANDAVLPAAAPEDATVDAVQGPDSQPEHVEPKQSSQE